QHRVPIGPDETIGTVMERVTGAYLRILEENLGALLRGTAPRRPQDHTRATYTCRRTPQDNRIDWTAPARGVLNLIRGVTAPYPAAYSSIDGKKLIVWAATLPVPPTTYVARVPGRVVEVRRGAGAVVLTGDGPLFLTQVQLEGGRPVCA